MQKYKDVEKPVIYYTGGNVFFKCVLERTLTNKLHVLTVDNKRTTFADEILPVERKVPLGKKTGKHIISTELYASREYEIEERKRAELERSKQIALEKQREEKNRKEKEAEEQKEREQQIAKMEHLKKCYNEIKDQFTQQETWIVDSSGQRWIKCEECDGIKLVDYFNSYGGINHVNLGVCTECARKKRRG